MELQVATEVTTIASQIVSNRERVDAATVARELAEKRLEAEQSKFEVGMSTNFFVVQAQRDLFDAQLTELRARLDYSKSLVDFDRVQQSSLSRPSLTSVTIVGGAANDGGTHDDAQGSSPHGGVRGHAPAGHPQCAFSWRRGQRRQHGTGFRSSSECSSVCAKSIVLIVVAIALFGGGYALYSRNTAAPAGQASGGGPAEARAAASSPGRR